MGSEDKSRTVEMSSLERTNLGLPGTDPSSFAGGRYEVQSLLGEGGQKRVYLARDSRLKREVVVSLLRGGQLSGNSVIRLWHEAEALGRLGDHPNIVTVYD